MNELLQPVVMRPPDDVTEEEKKVMLSDPAWAMCHNLAAICQRLDILIQQQNRVRTTGDPAIIDKIIRGKPL
jgi:hypothetical protein